MSHRIAIATSTGKFIDLHFGHADRFLIVDVHDGGYAAVETRLARPACGAEGHDEAGLNAAAALLQDCEGVFVSRIGQAAAQYVLGLGLRVFEAPYPVGDVLDKIIGDRLFGGGKETICQTISKPR